MRRTETVLSTGVAAAGLAVGLLLVVDAPPALIPTGALGAAIPVTLIYAAVTAEDASASG